MIRNKKGTQGFYFRFRGKETQKMVVAEPELENGGDGYAERNLGECLESTIQ